MEPLEPIQYQRLDLDALSYGVKFRLGGFAAARLNYRVRRDPVLHDLVYELNTQILGRKGPRKVYEQSCSATAGVVRFASWWDHFKATYRRRWWMRWRRWEVHYFWREETAVATARVVASIGVIFPHARNLPEQLGEPYSVIWVDGRESHL
jgi:hypothetical protein